MAVFKEVVARANETMGAELLNAMEEKMQRLLEKINRK